MEEYNLSPNVDRDYIEVNLDLHDKTSTSDVQNYYILKQGDHISRVLRCNLTKGGLIPIDLKNSVLTLYIKKADMGLVAIKGTIVDATNGIVDFPLTRQSLAIADKIICEVVKVGSDASTMSFPLFTLQVEDSIADDDMIESTDEFSLLNDALASVSDCENRLNTQYNEFDAKFDSKYTEISNQFETKYNGLEQEYAEELMSVKSGLEETNAQLSQKINVEKNRIDSLTTLAEGSTTGDAELMDIRIGANGFIYDNSGSSVRHQISTVNHAISEVSKKLINYITLENNYRNGVGFDKNSGTNKVVDYTASNIKSTSFDVRECEEYTVKTTVGNNWYGVIYSDHDNNFIGGALKDSSWQTYENFEIVIPPKCTKLLINCESSKEIVLQRKDYQPAVNKDMLDTEINKVKTKRTVATMQTINRLGYRENGGNENTMFAFKEAIKKGYNILLCDVRFTSDNVGVSLHDATINRTARNIDGTTIDGSVNINNITLEQANKYDYGISGGVSEIGIVTVEMLVKLCKMTNCELYLEYKDGSFSQYDDLFEMINRYGMIPNTTLTAGLNVLQRYGGKYPELRLGLNSSYSEANITELAKLITDKNEVFLFGWDSDNLTTEQVKFMSTNKVKYEFGNVNDVERLIELMNSNMVYATRVESDNLLIEEELYKHTIK